MNSKIKKFLKDIFAFFLTIILAIAVGIYAPKIYEKYKSHIKLGDYSMHFNRTQKSVIVYGTSSCIHCKKARDYLKYHNIYFEDALIDTSNESEKYFNSLGVESVPVLVTRDALVVGYREKDYEKILARNSSNPHN